MSEPRLGFVVEGKIGSSHFEWKKPVWWFKILHRIGRDKRKCGHTVIHKVTITGVALTSKPATGWID